MQPVLRPRYADRMSIGDFRAATTKQPFQVTLVATKVCAPLIGIGKLCDLSLLATEV
jgi:hypothetical protein